MLYEKAGLRSYHWQRGKVRNPNTQRSKTYAVEIQRQTKAKLKMCPKLKVTNILNEKAVVPSTKRKLFKISLWTSQFLQEFHYNSLINCKTPYQFIYYVYFWYIL